jgi:hypothetical protein
MITESEKLFEAFCNNNGYKDQEDRKWKIGY